MGEVQGKWRESLIDINKIPFSNIKLLKVISYPPAGNDVFECQGYYKEHMIEFFLKSERGEFANFSNEIKILQNIKTTFPVPKILESGKFRGYTYIATLKINGDKLSYLLKSNLPADKTRHLFEYGKMLAKIHNCNIEWEKARQRDINDYPKIENHPDLDEWERSVIDYLIEHKPLKIDYDTFIHGDFHYGNILWKNGKISGILDWEYAGRGFKEQDIAWALILRPEQTFMRNDKDVTDFLKGYKKIGTYNQNKLKWCLINGSMHFYLMNKNKGNENYLNTLKEKINLWIKKEPL